MIVIVDLHAMTVNNLLDIKVQLKVCTVSLDPKIHPFNQSNVPQPELVCFNCIAK